MLETILSLCLPRPDHFISIVLIRAITADTSDILKTNNQQNIILNIPPDIPQHCQFSQNIDIALHPANCPVQRLVSILPSVWWRDLVWYYSVYYSGLHVS